MAPRDPDHHVGDRFREIASSWIDRHGNYTPHTEENNRRAWTFLLVGFGVALAVVGVILVLAQDRG